MVSHLHLWNLAKKQVSHDSGSDASMVGMMHNASRNQMFKSHAALLWTISDFLAYANLCGWSIKGK